ncbi:1-phosphofructokinase family hexose kinase [Arthrobacter castelli]|uniref:1-phosphofructokinase family hexose kinase n=1 Tax=Arthrobacter castelli TaxID=271431 RepID=UPI0005604705|nr:1-phosphofructokinase family hexose kinase [Arthrobacter castelli]
MRSSSTNRALDIITVTPNPAIDVTYQIDDLQLGQSHRVPNPLNRAGGKGLNVGRVAHHMGHRVLAIAPVEDTPRSQIRADLELSGIPHILVPIQEQTRRTIALVDTVNDQTSILNESGAALNEKEWQALRSAIVGMLENPAERGSNPGVLVGCGSLPPNAPVDFYPMLVKLAHAHQMFAIIDTSGQQLIDAARAGADLLKPNSHELVEAMGETDLCSAAQKLIELGAHRVLVSMGAEGMLAFTSEARQHYWHARLPRPLHGNPTGAGDASVAAASAALASGVENVEQILCTATAWSAAAVLMPRAGEISQNYMELQQQLVITKEKSPCP